MQAAAALPEPACTTQLPDVACSFVTVNASPQRDVALTRARHVMVCCAHDTAAIVSSWLCQWQGMSGSQQCVLLCLAAGSVNSNAQTQQMLTNTSKHGHCYAGRNVVLEQKFGVPQVCYLEIATMYSCTMYSCTSTQCLARCV